MSWSSLMSASKHVALSMRTRTPKTAFLKVRQYKRMLHEGKKPPSFTDNIPSAAEMQEKVMGVLQPFGQSVAKFAKSNADVGAVVVLVPTSIIGTYYLWKKGKTEETETVSKANSPTMASLLSSQRADQMSGFGEGSRIGIPEPCIQNTPLDPDMVPCVSCAVPCGADANVSEMKDFDPSPLTIVGATLLTSDTHGESVPKVTNMQQKAEDSGLFIPVTVGQDAIQQPISATTMQNIATPVENEDECDEAKPEDSEPTEDKSQNANARRRRQRNPKEE